MEKILEGNEDSFLSGRGCVLLHLTGSTVREGTANENANALCSLHMNVLLKLL